MQSKLKYQSEFHRILYTKRNSYDLHPDSGSSYLTAVRLSHLKVPIINWVRLVTQRIRHHNKPKFVMDFTFIILDESFTGYMRARSHTRAV